MKEYQTISVQMPKKTFETLKDLAKKKYRSINQQINLFIAQKLEEQEKEAVEIK